MMSTAAKTKMKQKKREGSTSVLPFSAKVKATTVQLELSKCSNLEPEVSIHFPSSSSLLLSASSPLVVVVDRHHHLRMSNARRYR